MGISDAGQGISNAGHRAYKDEITRLIEIVQQEVLAWNFLAFAVKHVSADSQSQSTPTFAPTKPQLDDGCGDLKAYGTVNQVPQPYVEYNLSLSYFMDRAFQSKLAKSILGLQPDPSSTDDQLNNIKPLVPLAVEESRFGSDGPAFLFSQRTAPLVFTDKKECFPEGLIGSVEERLVADHRVYVLKADVAHLEYLVPKFKLEAVLEPFVKEWPPIDPAGKAHVGTQIVRAGLVNFVRAAGRRLDAFSYAFSPSEPDELVATRSLDEQSRTLAAQATAALAGLQGTGGAKVGQQSGVEQSRNASRKLVIAFGEQFNPKIATFGWVIQPQEPIDGNDDYRQRASQTSLAALISLPAWWEEIRVRITRSWTTESGKPENTLKPDQEYTIELPVNFETVDASLFETNDRSPVINEWATEAVIVRPCQRADIVIPGRRLWRSTVVLLGSQKADEIFVLPDMNGIVATFKSVQFPNTWSDLSRDFQVPLTVWTSQGSTSLPIPAIFHKLGSGSNEKTLCPTPAKDSDRNVDANQESR